MPILPQTRRLRRAVLADTTALLLFFTTAVLLDEHVIAGMTAEEVLLARLPRAALMIPVRRPYGVRRDWVIPFARTGRLPRALVSFQVPLSAVMVAASGASGHALLRGVLGATVLTVGLGRPYGAFLGWVGARFGPSPGRMRPVSPDP